jgi:flagellum-specific peptidoglycan hydrolase FlgJ
VVAAEEDEEPADEEEAQKPAEEEAEEEEELVVHNKKGKKRGHDEESNGNADEANIKKVLKQLNEVSEEFITQFKGTAQEVATKHKSDPLVPLAAAIAILTGATKVNPKSILTDREVNN